MIKRLLLNWPWKLLSLFLATVYWMAVASEPEMVTVLRAPVQFKDPPRDLVVSTEVVSSVNLELTGVSGRLREFSAAPSPVVLDLSHVRAPGERTFNIDQHTVRLPRGVELIRAVPAQLRFTFERLGRRDVPIEVRWSGDPPRGSSIEKFETQPAYLTVVGPESRVNRLASVLTDPVDLTKLKSGETVTTHPYIEDAQLRFENFQRIHVTVTLKN